MIWLIKQIDLIIFGLTINLLCIFDIYWVSTAVVLVKNVLLLVPTEKQVLEIVFSKCFLIKMWKVCFLSNGILKKCGKWPENYVLILHSYWNPQFQNFSIPPIWLSHSIIQRYWYPCIALSLDSFQLLPIC